MAETLLSRALRFALRLIHWRRRNARHIILMGGPGAGKGTLASSLAPALGVPHLSMGNLFRAEIAAGTELGLRIEPLVTKGKLVPDPDTIHVLERELEQEKCDVGAVHDGFPRTFNQAGLLNRLLGRRWGLAVERVILIEVPKADLIERLCHRRTCTNKLCGRTYHLLRQPPKESGKCDACGHALYQRADDVPTAIEERISVFEAESQSLRDYYQRQGLLVRVQSTNAKGPDAVFAEVLTAVKANRS